MATPKTAAAPDAPNSSSPLRGNGVPFSLVGWFTAITDFIRGLSPSGSAAHDTGWVSITLDSGYTGGNPKIRRIGRIVHMQAGTISGTIPTGTTQIGTNAIPDGFRPSQSERGAAYLTGGRPGVSGADSSGNIYIFHQDTAGTRTTCQFSMTWMVD